MNRSVPDTSPTRAFTALEIRMLDQLGKGKGAQFLPRKSISKYLTKIARLGDYFARASDSPRGNIVGGEVWPD
jgi:hypothetical protein